MTDENDPEIVAMVDDTLARITAQDIIDAYFDGCLHYREAYYRLLDFGLTTQQAMEYLDT